MYCSNCGKEVEVNAKFCKHCGVEVEREKKKETEPEQEKVSKATENIPSYEIPKMIPQEILREGEKVIFEVRPHRAYTLLGPFIGGAILILLGVVIFGVLFGVWIPGALLLGGILVVIGFVLAIGSLIKQHFTVYCLTTNRVITRRGMIGKGSYETSLERIQDLGSRIGVLQRLFSCGNIMMTTAGTSGVECLWRNIENPEERLNTLRTLLAKW